MISEEDIKRVATLSRLHLTKDEVTTATQNVGGILEHFSVIQNIKTEGVKSAEENRDLANITKPDTANTPNISQPEDLLANAPATLKNQIKVKAVFIDPEHI